jgi:hypothetical protein
MRGRPARALLIGVATALLIAAAIGMNVVLLGYANREPQPAGRLSPRTTLTTTTPPTPVQTTTDDDGSHGSGSERDD